jgi:ATP-binding protein involved in chromosome partitioning
MVENMSRFVCPGCGGEHDVFGHGGGERVARELQHDFLGRIPLEPGVCAASDEGTPVVIASPGSASAREYRAVAERVAAKIFAPS